MHPKNSFVFSYNCEKKKKNFWSSSISGRDFLAHHDGISRPLIKRGEESWCTGRPGKYWPVASVRRRHSWHVKDSQFPHEGIWKIGPFLTMVSVYLCHRWTSHVWATKVSVCTCFLRHGCLWHRHLASRMRMASAPHFPNLERRVGSLIAMAFFATTLTPLKPRNWPL